jgi:ribosomal protein S18 acetylase RimI-like enzyme
LSIALRHAEPDDYPPIVRVVDALWGGRAMAGMLPRLFFTHFRPTSFAAEDDGRLVGFVAGFVSQTDPRQAYIHFVGVDPACRGHGVGRLLYERFFAAAQAQGCEEVRCVTSPVNRGSIAFHLALGFEPLPGDAEQDGVPYATDYDGPGESRIRFRRRLTTDETP